MSDIRIIVGDLILLATLETETAPATCAAFLAMLPLRARILQARWSGQSSWVPLDDVDIELPAENPMHRPAPGQLLFYPADESGTEILVPYGLTTFAAKCGALWGNHFLTVNSPLALLEEVGRRAWYEGAQTIVFARIGTD